MTTGKNGNDNASKDDSSLEKELSYTLEHAWARMDTQEREDAVKLARSYMNFLGKTRTERRRIKHVQEFLESTGFQRIGLDSSPDVLVSPGDKVYYINKDRNLAAFIIGENSLLDGSRLLAAHVDYPKIDLKVRPLYEDDKSCVALFKTHYYGGIKKYQYASIPLALVGVVFTRDGKEVPVDIGLDPGDPVFTIPDLLIHLHKNVQSKRKTSDVMKGEEMNALIAAFPDDDGNAKEKFKLTVLRGLNRKYGITEEDFHASELSLVPVMGPRHVGIDASMIGGAGQDDGICSFAAARALGAVDGIPPSTAGIALFDKEEIGSNGPTGARSSWLHHVMNDLMLRAGIDDRSKNLNRCLEKVKVLSADVTAALDPTFKSVHDPKSAAVLGKGIAIMKYTGHGGKIGANDASGRYMAFLGEIFSRNGVPFQVTSLGAVDAGGGGTIAKYIAESFNCDVVDAGPSLLNMHSPFEISHVADLHATWKGFKVFLKS